MKYTIREDDKKVARLYRYGERVLHDDALPSNAEYEFWCVLQAAVEACKAIESACPGDVSDLDFSKLEIAMPLVRAAVKIAEGRES